MVYTHETLEKALKTFQMAYLAAFEANDSKQSFYCGVTNNLERRRGEHHVASYATSVECDNFETAKVLEQLLSDEGFDTGNQDGNGKENSVFVYMYRKIPGETQE